MMNGNSIIAVWGSPASGKSTFSAILARHLTRNKSKAIIISPDITAPMLPVWFPTDSIENRMSLGHVLTSHEIHSGVIAEKVKLLKSYPYVGVLGYTSGDMPLSYPDASYDKIQRTIEVAAEMVDYVIIDCTSRVTDLFTPAAIEVADVVVGIFTADLRGISYRKSSSPLLNGPKFKVDEHMIFAGNARPYNALDEFEHFFGRLNGILPWSKEIDKAVGEGTVFSAEKYCTEKYVAALKSVAKRVNGGVQNGVEQT